MQNEKKEKSMNLKPKIQKVLIFLIIKCWIHLFANIFFDNSKGCLAFDDSQRFTEKEGDLPSILYNHSFTAANNNSIVDEPQLCYYFSSSNCLICTGSINFSYLKTIKNTTILDFIVEKYEADSIYKKKYWFDNDIQTGAWYTKLPKTYQKLVGELYLKDTGILLNLILRLVPRQDQKGFLIDGEIFSTKIVKISWRVIGGLSLEVKNNHTIVSVNLDSCVNDGDWKLQSNLTFNQREENSDIDKWKVFGIIKSAYVSKNKYIFFNGIVETRMMKGECRFSGKLTQQNANLMASVSGKVSSPQNKQITIPKEAFSGMIIKNIVFKDSFFFNDFDKYSFQDLQKVETISYIGSKLEVMPRISELFQPLTSLREIYIEDCITPGLKFGSLSALENIQSLSLKGSGPLQFDDTSFLWLQNSNLTFLNLQDSHIKISPTATSVLWSVRKSLKKLDISHATLSEERDLISLLNGLHITSLKAESLKLRKIPTNVLTKVRKTLKNLSLRGNDFRKTLEKHIFDNIFNFPLMENLVELNLMECHINYIEKGSFDNLPNLEILYIGYNNLENLQDGWSSIKPQIKSLDMSYNGLLPMVKFLDPANSLNMSAFTKLEILNLSNGIFTNPNKLISTLGNGLKNLSLRNIGLEGPSENIFQNLQGLQVLDLSFNRNMKTVQSFSFKPFKNLRNLTILKLSHCRISNSQVLKDDNEVSKNVNSENYQLRNLEILDLSYNNIKIIDSGSFEIFPKIKILNLTGNSVAKWNTSLFSFSKNLETLFIDENKIEFIPNNMLSDIRKLKYAKLGENPFICGSYIYEFLKIVSLTNKNNSVNKTIFIDDFDEAMKVERWKTDFGQRYNSIASPLHHFKGEENDSSLNESNVTILDWSDYNYVCFSWSQLRFVPFIFLNETFEDLVGAKPEIIEKTQFWLPVVAVVGVVVTVGIICWKYLDVHLITRAVRNAVSLSFTTSKEKEILKYDYNVFVSYSDKDKTWVFEHLLPHLESWGEMKVCLHERDFKVGFSIVENIIDSIDSSKNIILVLSQAFLKSQWCQYEMHLAQHRLLEKGRDQLILIFLENIPAIKRPKTLRYLMMTKTYLEWPGNSRNPKKEQIFWNRLMKSLIKFDLC